MRQGLIFFIRSRKRLRRRSRRSRRKISPLRTKPKGEMFSSVGCNRTPIFRSKRSFARLDAFRGKVSFGGPSRIFVFCASRRHICVLPVRSDLAGGDPGGQTSQIRAQNAPGRHLSRRTALLKSAKTARSLVAFREVTPESPQEAKEYQGVPSSSKEFQRCPKRCPKRCPIAIIIR